MLLLLRGSTVPPLLLFEWLILKQGPHSDMIVCGLYTVLWICQNLSLSIMKQCCRSDVGSSTIPLTMEEMLSCKSWWIRYATLYWDVYCLTTLKHMWAGLGNQYGDLVKQRWVADMFLKETEVCLQKRIHSQPKLSEVIRLFRDHRSPSRRHS